MAKMAPYRNHVSATRILLVMSGHYEIFPRSV